MSGHSKWSTIKRKKEATDAKKGQLFSKLSKLIEITAKKGADPKTNFSLKAVVDKAKASNMPVINIEKAIKKGAGLGANVSNLEEILYEAYGPGGVAILITGVTDNKNRTTAEIKHILTQHEANLSGVGSVKWLFESKYEDGNAVWVSKQTIKLSDTDENKLEGLMEELDEQEDVSEVYTNAE
ncbi:MAG: YebC/PmpR family DNA-binding transcriptional regulator [bacterium]|nr:YebC/PmpR family DNA-binding transcriptional regulator [bacterium]